MGFFHSYRTSFPIFFHFILSHPAGFCNLIDRSEKRFNFIFAGFDRALESKILTAAPAVECGNGFRTQFSYRYILAHKTDTVAGFVVAGAYGSIAGAVLGNPVSQFPDSTAG